MNFNLFGFKIEKISDEKQSGVSFVPPHTEDGSLEFEKTQSYLGYSAQNEFVLNLDEIPKNDKELTYIYRNMALNLDVDAAIQEIVNEAIITDDLKANVELILDNIDTLSDNIKDKIRAEFNEILKLLKFKNDGFGLFRKWYIDGKLYFHKVIDKDNTKKGILALLPIDPLHIRPIRVTSKHSTNSQLDLYKLDEVEEYFIYSQTPFDTTIQTDSTTAVKIPREAITYVHSGLFSLDGKTVLSNLYKAIKPFNNLKMMEDALVIYRVSRAPERRVFYIDTGSLPSGKANQYIKDVMNRFKTKITYDVNTGAIQNRKNFQSMIEDYWLPRKDGSRGTEISTLPGGENLNQLDDVTYFKEKLYKSLNVPLSRFQGDQSAFNLGRTTEITRDEIRFHKFIVRLRNQFSKLFDDILKTQLLLKQIITKDEWDKIKNDISYSFLEDNYFQELKEMEIVQERLNVVQAYQQADIIGKYISNETIRKHVLKQSESEIEAENKLIEEEQKNPLYAKEDSNGY